MKIFVTVGTQKHDFKRLINCVDNLEGDFLIQTGYSSTPKNHEYIKFTKNMSDLIAEADVVITHGGVGTIIEVLKHQKPLIVIPRLLEFNEHVDNHQVEISKFIEINNYGLVCKNMDNLKSELEKIDRCKFNKYKFDNENFITKLEKIIDII